MRYYSYNNFENSTSVEVSQFSTATGSANEYMVVVKCTKQGLPFATVLENVLREVNSFREGIKVFQRFFLSDAANQQQAVREKTIDDSCATSIIEQPLLDGSKIAVWAYFQTDVTLENCVATHGAYSHIWSGGMLSNKEDSKLQTEEIFETYLSYLAKQDVTLELNCIRTWLFVQNVDVNYWGVVVGRNNIFDKQDLTDKTHFISSTGIQGRTANYKNCVAMDSYAVKGIKRGQIQFLYGASHLNSTAEYGVRFERGTTVHYGDRSHTFISGTASIDNHGDVLYIGDIEKQSQRMIENVEVLLSEVSATFNDVAQIIIYIRDIADYSVVAEFFESRFAQIPKVILHAPVCRPTWLIEMECIAIKESYNSEFENF